MKKYKLIKEYPGSPSLGTEIEKRTVYADKWMFTRDCNLFPVTSGTPEDYPDYWEEVVEKDYEILTMQCKWSSSEHSAGDIIVHRPDILCYKYSEDCFNIHSIKRLLDGEIFTVGDKVKSKHWSVGSSIIDEFGMVLDKFCILETKYKIDKSCWLSLDCIEHVKNKLEPLFTTEDGVDIFEGDKYWIACPNSNWDIQQEPACKIDYLQIDYFQKDWGYKYFSTKEAAEEYVLMNKPCLSINNLLEDFLFSSSLDSLKKLVKSKL